jgi:hypothetical protein
MTKKENTMKSTTIGKCSVVAALFVGAIVGSGLATAAGCGTARADGSGPPQGQLVTVPCNVKGTTNDGPVTFAVQAFPGSSREDLAMGVSEVFAMPSLPPNLSVGGDTSYIDVADLFRPAPYVKDGSVAVQCSGQATVQLYVRQ